MDLRGRNLLATPNKTTGTSRAPCDKPSKANASNLGTQPVARLVMKAVVFHGVGDICFGRCKRARDQGADLAAERLLQLLCFFASTAAC